jgi:hypothetical protein
MHALGGDRLLIFNNNTKVAGAASSGTGDGSIAIELSIDRGAKQSTQQWSYKSNIQNDVMGDLQRLPNGNTIIGYSIKGILQEVGADQTVLQEWTWPTGSTFGYIEKRASLYGVPLR